MKCPSCQHSNREGVKFCEECGLKLDLKCSECNANLPLGTKFCGECGQRLIKDTETTKSIRSIDSERKHVTVLFTDLTGYTAMAERLDPEESKEILNRIFSDIANVIEKYEGFVEKFIGDAVMAIFGVPKAHEDDPTRAIRAALEIHGIVANIGRQFKDTVGPSFSMHSGINTGLVVTGEVNLEKGTHGLSGDTINTASRLSSHAGNDEIIVGHETYRQSIGFFDFDPIEPIEVKGKKKPVSAYKLSSAKDQPVTIHRLHGVRAKLIGRKFEAQELKQAVANLKNGKGSIIAICGTAGTGKSRLIDEFKSRVDFESVQWLEGYAYPYTINTPYFPLVNLLNKALQIDEEDTPEAVNHKIKDAINALAVDANQIFPYIGSLYSIPYPEIERMSPENWKVNLQNAMVSVLSALSRQKPTIVFLEDLHWADPSFLELIRYVLLKSNDPILFICAYRPQITLFTTHQISQMFYPFRELNLSDLSPSDSQTMVESLLKTENIPIELKKFIHDKIQGNPFYLEEVINSLIETKTLVKEQTDWRITQPITEKVISSTIHGVIASRMDRLEHETKRILQEASVIGTAFYYQVLKRVSMAKENIDRSLSILERLDLIRMKALEPDLEYIFKHGLTQEVVYNGILKKERQIVHEQIGIVIEQLFQDRLPEFYDALAFHFKKGQTKDKAVHYLVKSGEKSLRRYSVEESDQYYKEAYALLRDRNLKIPDKEKALVSLLNNWALTLYYLGAFGRIEQLFARHEKDALRLGEQSLLGMYYVWLGMSLYCRERFQEAVQNLLKALEIGRIIEDNHVIAYALTWLCWSKVDLGKFDEIPQYAKEARGLYESGLVDAYPYYKASGGEGLANFMAGNSQRNKALGEDLLRFGDKNSHIRATVLGHVSIAYSHDSAGNYPLAIEYYERAIQVAKDPMYAQYARLFLAMSLLQVNQVKEAEQAFTEVIEFCDKNGFEAVGSPAKFYFGFVQVLNGQLSAGMKNIEGILKRWVEIDRKPVTVMAYFSLGKLYAQIASGSESVSIGTILKNIGFVIKNVPSATRKAEDYFFRAIELTERINANGLKAQSLLELGLLYKNKGKNDKAAEYLKKAIKLFSDYGNYIYLEQARSALESIQA